MNGEVKKPIDLAAWRSRLKTPSKEGWEALRRYKARPESADAPAPITAEDIHATRKARIDAAIHAPEVLEPFTRFWAVYPRKVGKRAALIEWWRMKLSPVKIDEIIAGTVRYAEKVKTWDKKYIKHPAGWLIAERWTDED